jgi:hypothetical protein
MEGDAREGSRPRKIRMSHFFYFDFLIIILEMNLVIFF